MCGIAGIAGVRTSQQAALEEMTDLLWHRGPDEGGVWFSAEWPLGLGHRRLSILDLSPRAAQPMVDDATGVVLTYNGELYNFRALRSELKACGHAFQSTGDTEVVLRSYLEWGQQCWRRFDGMFALAVHDPREQMLTLVRDRIGEKPLYYTVNGPGFAFASELKSILALRSHGWSFAVDQDALDEYLAHGYVAAPTSILGGVAKLPPGQRLTVDLEGVSADPVRYCDPLPVAKGAAFGDPVARLDEVLASSVRDRLVADVPVGVLLSGGLDSSLITAMAARAASGTVQTFTVTFPGSPVDEAVHARRVADAFGTTHHELLADPSEVSLLTLLARQFDEPLADSSILPTFLVCRLVQAHATVALGGDGADELFGGYLHYQRILKRERMRRMLGAPGRGALRFVADLLPTGQRGKHELQRLAAADVVGVPTLFDARDRWRLLGVRRLPTVGFAQHADPSLVGARRAMSHDTATYLPDDILAKVDRASMLSSLEVRSPFLASDVVDLAYSLPDALTAAAAQRKVLLRKLASKVLPGDLDLDRKQGFSIPVNEWLRHEWRDFAGDVLRPLGAGSPFDATYVERLLAGHQRGRANGSRIFALLMFELWRHEYGVSM